VQDEELVMLVVFEFGTLWNVEDVYE